MTHNYSELALELHKKLQGKIESKSKIEVKSLEDLSKVYTPGVGAVSNLLANQPELARQYTIKHNTVAVISDGSAVLGLGNIGPYGALPVMEGKAMLFSQLGGLNAFPIVLDTQDSTKIIETITHIAPVFAAINLEDIQAPQCFDIEERLQTALDIPVVHDDQHATAIVVLAGIINSLKVVGKLAKSSKVVIQGAGAAGIGTAKLLHTYGFEDIIVVDSKGIISTDRPDLNSQKLSLAVDTNIHNQSGDLADAIDGSDIFVGLSTGGKLTQSFVQKMNAKPIIFALSNPEPEIMPSHAFAAGAAIVATGRSDFPNQINNVLVFPGLFKGLIEHSIKTLSDKVKIRAAEALASVVKNPVKDKIIPSVFESQVVSAIAQNIH